FSRAHLKVGRSLPDRSGSGTLFMELGSPASAVPRASRRADAAKPAVPARKSRRLYFDMGSPWKAVAKPPTLEAFCRLLFRLIWRTPTQGPCHEGGKIPGGHKVSGKAVEFNPARAR